MFGSTISKFLKIDTLVENLTGWFEAKVELVKVEVRQELTRGLAIAIQYLIFAFVFGLVILFVSLGVAVLLANRLGPLAGYGIVAVFYLIVGLILVASRQSIKDKLENGLSQEIKKKK